MDGRGESVWWIYTTWQKKLTQLSAALLSFCFLCELPYVSMTGSSQRLIQPATCFKSHKTTNRSALCLLMQVSFDFCLFFLAQVSPVNGGARSREAWHRNREELSEQPRHRVTGDGVTHFLRSHQRDDKNDWSELSFVSLTCIGQSNGINDSTNLQSGFVVARDLIIRVFFIILFCVNY